MCPPTGADDSTPTPGHLSRRQVLLGGVTVVAGLGGVRLAAPGRVAAAVPPDFAVTPSPPELVTSLRRREDLLDLRFEFFNLRFADDGSGRRLVRRNPNAPAYFAVVLGSQALAERAFPERAGEGELGDGHADNDDDEALSAPLGNSERAYAGESRLAFTVPADMTSIPYNLEALLDWTAFEPRLVPVASGQPDPQPPGQIVFGQVPQIREPRPDETAIELPWRLQLSPHAGAGWAHATGLVTRNGRTEMWHTRLGVRAGEVIDEWDEAGRTVRAIWTPDLDSPADPFLTSLDSGDRQDIVDASSRYEPHSTPVPAQVKVLMLAPLGGWLDLRGAWEPTGDNDLEEWRHQATMGRDHYVRVVRRGYLFPYGHRVSLVKITERRFETYEGDTPPALNGQQGAFLRQRIFLVVIEPEKRYAVSGAAGAGFGQPDEGRAWPFASLRFTTLVTPILDDAQPGPLTIGDAFVPTVGHTPFAFHVAGTDREGRKADFSTPVVFVPGTESFSPGGAGASLVAAFNGLSADHAMRLRDFGGQKIALAEPTEPGDTAVDVGELVLGAVEADADASDLEEHGQPRFYPAIAELETRLSAAEQASGADLGTSRFTLGPYVAEGFGSGNPGEVFAVAVGDATPVGFDADRAGGLMTPNVDIGTLSRKLGAVGGDPGLIQGGGGNEPTFDPTDVFAAGAARLLGGIDLADIIEAANIASDPDKAMRITTRPEFGDGEMEPPTALITELEWEPDLRPDPLGLFDPWESPPDPQDATLLIEASFRQDLAQPADSTYEIEGDLQHFRLNLVGSGDATKFMVVTFDHLRFTARTGAKTDIDVGIDSIAFAGPLQFVNEIREYLTFGGSGPFIDLQPSGVTAGYQLALPQIPLGMLMFNNIALSAALSIPFSGAPARIRFGLSSRDNPFDVTYSAIGGGGYFGIAFGLDGLEKFECAIELGAYLSMDFGVASGSVCLCAGICFEIEYPEGSQNENVALTAYIRFFGKVQVLGLVGLSLEIYLGLTFEPTPPKLTGRAWAELEVTVLFFSGSVKVEVERKISATQGDPSFADLFDEQHWNEYALAFA